MDVGVDGHPHTTRTIASWSGPLRPRGVLGLSSPQRNEELERKAGFTEVFSQELRGVLRFDSPEDDWTSQSSLAGPLRAAVASMGTDEVSAARATVEEMLASFRSNDGFELPTTLVMAAAS